jgi:MFS family permease
VSPLAGVASDRVGPGRVVAAGLSVMLVGYLLMTRLTTETPALGYVLIGLPLSIGLGIFQSPNNSAIMGSVSRDRLGVTSGLLTITRITGQLSGISLFGTVWATRVAAHWGKVGPPASAPPSAQVAGLRETFVAVALLIGVAVALAVPRSSGADPDPGG